MGDEDNQVNHMPKMAAEKTDITNVIMEIQVARQKQSGGNHCGDHASAMGCDFAAHNQAAANQQQNRTGSIQASDQPREVGILLRNHAGGLVVRRFTMKKDKLNMAAANRPSAVMEKGREVSVGLAGKSSPRKASTP